ncbi:MAG: hypothetical protein GY719_00210 [bacterium]|nr:hypothetical protein [bacterium]
MKRLDSVEEQAGGGFDDLPSGGVVPFRAGLGLTQSPEEPAGTGLPDRYEIREREDGRSLHCGEAPGVAVSINQRHQFSEAEARRLGERVVFLDGAGQFGPVIDNKQQLYNLDHHQDCLRAFTLATCEQALIMVLKGLDLDQGDWTVYANEPDLDTLFAIWVLLNHRRVRQLTPVQRDAILPLLHLEGAIDANGFEIGAHCGLPQELLTAEKARLDVLHRRELDLKGAGGWNEADLVEYSREMLLAIDQLVYQPSDFDDYARVEQVYGHVDIGGNKVAVVCRDSSGIYEVEQRLKKSWGDRLGVIALERAAGQYTLRRAASLAGIDLAQAYDKLNLLDPRVDGRPPEKRWGGSDEIGGSPRPEGTALTPNEIGKILRMTYRRVRPVEDLQRHATAALWVLLLILGAAASVASWRVFFAPPGSSPGDATELALAAAVIVAGSWLLTRKLSSGWTWLFGWRRAAGRDWLAMVPLVLVGAAGGGVWMPRDAALDPLSLGALAGSMALAAVALELCFRGLVHGLLVLDSPVQTVAGRWFVSVPNLASSALYAFATAVATWRWIAGPPLGLAHLQQLALWAAAAFLAGLALGMIRERSLSVWPGVGAAILGGAVRVAIEIFYLT